MVIFITFFIFFRRFSPSAFEKTYGANSALQEANVFSSPSQSSFSRLQWSNSFLPSGVEISTFSMVIFITFFILFRRFSSRPLCWDPSACVLFMLYWDLSCCISYRGRKVGKVHISTFLVSTLWVSRIFHIATKRSKREWAQCSGEDCTRSLFEVALFSPALRPNHSHLRCTSYKIGFE